MSDQVSRRNVLKLAGVSVAAAVVGTALDGAHSATAHSAEVAPAAALDAATNASLGAAVPNAQVQAVLTELAKFENVPIQLTVPRVAREEPSVADAVKQVLSRQGRPVYEAVSDVSHVVINGPGGQLLVRFYTPAGAGPHPMIVYFHGGGFVIANLNVYDASCRALCNTAGAVVASVAYRQAPEYRFPAAVEDAYAATQYLTANAARFGADPKRVAVAGESAGGNLATVVSILARDRGGRLPVHQTLIYPLVDWSTNYPSFVENAAAEPLNKPLALWFAKYYLRTQADAKNPLASPILTKSLRGLPSATIITAQIDPLRDEGAAYAKRLTDAGVATTYTLYTNVTHEFFAMNPVVDKGRQAVQQAAAELRAAFNR